MALTASREVWRSPTSLGRRAPQWNTTRCAGVEGRRTSPSATVRTGTTTFTTRRTDILRLHGLEDPNSAQPGGAREGRNRCDPQQPRTWPGAGGSAQRPGQHESSTDLNAHAVPGCTVVSLQVQSRYDGSQTDRNWLAQLEEYAGDAGRSPAVCPEAAGLVSDTLMLPRDADAGERPDTGSAAEHPRRFEENADRGEARIGDRFVE